jgi:hypothetical protein
VREATPETQPTELAQIIRKMKDKADHCKVWDPVTDAESENNERAARWSTAETTIRVLHTHDLYSVESILEKGMPMMKKLTALPQRIQARWTKQHMNDLQEAIRDTEALQNRIRAIDVSQRLANQPEAVKRPRVQDSEKSPWGRYELDMSAFENADAFELGGGRTGELVLDFFSKIPFLGIVAAMQKDRRGNPLTYRVIFSDGDVQDYEPEKVEAMYDLATDPEGAGGKSPSMGFPEQIVEAEWYANQWRTRHPGIVESICQKRIEELQGIRFLVCWKWGKNKSWRDNIYEVDTDANDCRGTWLWKIKIDRRDNLIRTQGRVLLEHGENGECILASR